METLSLQARDMTFDARVIGPPDGRVVLALHGFPQTSRSWARVAPALADAGHRVVAPDQRGYSPGARPADVADYAMPELVADTLALADAIGAERFDLLGHDWGAAVAWQVAARHPARVRSLTAVSIPHPLAFREALMTDDDQRERSQYMVHWREHTPSLEELHAEFGGDGDVADPDALRAGLNWYRAMDVTSLEGVGAVDVPTLYVWSSEDPAVGRFAAEATERHVSGPYRFVVLDGVSHWIPEEEPQRLAALLLEHLANT